MKYSVRAGIGDRHVLARTRTDRIVSSEGKRRTQQELLLRSGRHVSQFLLLRLCRTHLRSARRFAFVRLLRPSACSLRFFLRRNGIVRPQQTLSIQMPQRSGIWGTDHSRPSCTCEYCKTRQQMLGFSIKNDLTTFFANVTCAAIGDRIVSVQRRGGSLGSSIRLTIFHSSFPSFSVST
jgi:hypothetical protein